MVEYLHVGRLNYLCHWLFFLFLPCWEADPICESAFLVYLSPFCSLMSSSTTQTMGWEHPQQVCRWHWAQWCGVIPGLGIPSHCCGRTRGNGFQLTEGGVSLGVSNKLCVRRGARHCTGCLGEAVLHPCRQPWSGMGSEHQVELGVSLLIVGSWINDP